MNEVRISESVNSWHSLIQTSLIVGHSLIQTSLIAIASFCLVPSSFASYATNWFGEGNGSTNTITVNFKPTGTPFVLPDGETIVSYVFRVTATNGILASTYLAPGPWTVTFGGSFDTWQLNVPYDTNTYALWQLATNVNALTNFPTITEIIYNEGNGGAATNATLLNLYAGSATLVTANTTGPSNGISGVVSNNGVFTITMTNASSVMAAQLASQGTAITNWADATFETIAAANGMGTAITNAYQAFANQVGAACTNGYTALCTVVSNGVVAWDNATFETIAAANSQGTAITNWANETFQPLAALLTTLSGNATANSVWGANGGSTGWQTAPAVSGANLTANTVPLASLAQGTLDYVVAGNGSSAATYQQPAFSWLSGSATMAQLPSAYGTAISNWVNAAFQPLSSILTTLSGNAPADTVWGNATGSAGAPSYTGNPTVTNLVVLGLTDSEPVVTSSGDELVSMSYSTFAGNLSLSAIGGSLGVAQINATGTASSSTYLRGDGTWSTPSAGGSSYYNPQNFLTNGSSQVDLSAAVQLTGSLTASTLEFTNLYMAALLNNWSNTYVGYGSGNYSATPTGGSNQADGSFALGSITSGDENIAMGIGAGYDLTTGNQNIAIGPFALNGNGRSGANSTSGNIAIGYQCMYNGSSGGYNTGIGWDCMQFMQGGVNDTAVGVEAANGLTTGNENTAIGANALEDSTSASWNTAVGFNALAFNLTGSNNTAIGMGALARCLSSNNVGVGFNAGLNLTNGFNNIYVGANVPSVVPYNSQSSGNIFPDETNTTRVGMSQTVAYIAGVVVSSNGFASLCTNTPAMTTTGYTNSFATVTNNVEFLGFTGTSVVFSNSASKYNQSLGTITTGITFILTPGSSVTGSSCAAAASQGL
jgi:hypothetical protein